MSIDLLLITISLFTWGIGEGLFIYFIPLSLQEWGADPILIGAVLGGIGLAISLAQIPAGWFSDRYGPRYLMWAAWSLGTVAALIMAFATSLWMFVIALWLYYFTAFAVAPMNAYIVMAKGKFSIARALTLVSGMYNLGAAAGPLVGGLIAEKWELQSIYLVSSGIFILSTIVIYFAKDQKPNPAPKNALQKTSLFQKKFLMFVGLAMLTVFILYLPQPLTSNYLQNVKLLSKSQIGLLGTIGNTGNAFAALVLGGIHPTIGLIVGQLSVAAYSLILWKTDQFGIFGIAYFILGGYRLARNMITSKIRSFVNDREVGLAFGILETACGMSVILAPLLAGLIYKLDATLPYKLAIPLTLCLIPLTIIFSNKQDEKNLRKDAK